MKINYILILFFCLLMTYKTKDIDKILYSFDEELFFPIVKDIMVLKLSENYIEIDEIFNRNITKKGINMLVIPQFIVKYDSDNNLNEIILDSINPINRAILFNNNKVIASLIFPIEQDILFCPKEITNVTCFDCGKYIIRENNYYRSIKLLLKEKPIIIFKSFDFERVWFYLDKDMKIKVLTYELEKYTLEDFLNKPDLAKYSLPINVILK